MRILIVDTFYPAFVRDHYARHPGLEERPYGQQWRSLMDTFFATADSYSHHLRELGHEAHELVVNCAPLQNAWARDHAIRLRPPSTARRRGAAHDELVLCQVEAFAPDVVYFQNVQVLRRSTLRSLRSEGIRIAGQVATEPPRRARLRLFDVIVTSIPPFVERFRRAGIPTEHLRLAFDPRVLERLRLDGPPIQRHDTVFIGALDRFLRWRSNHVLERAARRVPVEFWGYGARQWPKRSPLRRNYRGHAWGLDMFRILRAARISLNRHGNVSGDYAHNMRLYEATGVGSLVLTDHKPNLSELFEVGGEIVSYTDDDDLVRKVGHYLGHEDERREVAAAGQRRTVREHGYNRRMAELAGLLERAL